MEPQPPLLKNERRQFKNIAITSKQEKNLKQTKALQSIPDSTYLNLITLPSPSVIITLWILLLNNYSASLSAHADFKQTCNFHW